jgi:hypothetical protein
VSGLNGGHSTGLQTQIVHPSVSMVVIVPAGQPEGHLIDEQSAGWTKAALGGATVGPSVNVPKYFMGWSHPSFF